MKKAFLYCLMLFLVFSMVGCGAFTLGSNSATTDANASYERVVSNDFNDSTNIFVEGKGLIIPIPSNWKADEKNEDNSDPESKKRELLFFAEEGSSEAYLKISFNGGYLNNDNTDLFVNKGKIISGVKGSKVSFSEPKTIDVGGEEAVRVDLVNAIDEKKYNTILVSSINTKRNGAYITLLMTQSEDTKKDYSEDFEKIIQGCAWDKEYISPEIDAQSDEEETEQVSSQTDQSNGGAIEQATTQADSSNTETAQNNQPQESTPQNATIPSQGTQALAKAKEYLRIMNFSYTGLIQQLEFEGFPNDAATYGAANCGADWNSQALGKAKDYLTIMNFSYKGIIQQLKFEGFTNEEATYGANNCGADWKAQAAGKAKDYMNLMSFSYNGLIDQLKFEGFTDEEAKFGADNCGTAW